MIRASYVYDEATGLWVPRVPVQEFQTRVDQERTQLTLDQEQADLLAHPGQYL